MAKPKVVVISTNAEAKNTTTKPIPMGEFNTSENSAANSIENIPGLYSTLVRVLLLSEYSKPIHLSPQALGHRA